MSDEIKKPDNEWIQERAKTDPVGTIKALVEQTTRQAVAIHELNQKILELTEGKKKGKK